MDKDVAVSCPGSQGACGEGRAGRKALGVGGAGACKAFWGPRWSVAPGTTLCYLPRWPHLSLRAPTFLKGCPELPPSPIACPLWLPLLPSLPWGQAVLGHGRQGAQAPICTLLCAGQSLGRWPSLPGCPWVWGAQGVVCQDGNGSGGSCPRPLGGAQPLLSLQLVLRGGPPCHWPVEGSAAE